jgi:hypothetical protein
MKKSLLFLLFVWSIYPLNGCGSGNSTPPPPLATQLVVSPASSTITAGKALSFTVTAVGASGAVASGYSGTVHFISNDSQAALPSDSKLTNGTGTFSATFKTAGGVQFTATDTVTPSISGGTPINVNAGPVSQFAVTTSMAATTGLPINLTIVAQDSFGNAAIYAGTLHFTSTDAQAVLPANSPFTNGTGNFTVTFKTIGSQTITATDTVTVSLKATSNAISVVSNAPTHLSVNSPGSANTRAAFNVTVSALDAANNVSAGYSGTVHFTSSDAQAKLPADSSLTAGTGKFSATLETAGTQTVMATDTSSASISGSSSINVATALTLTISSGAPPAGIVGSNYDPHNITYCILMVFPDICVQRTTLRVYGFPLAGTGGVPPYSWGWTAAAGSSLPAGLNVVNLGNISCGTRGSPRPACISGTPTQPGTYNVVLTVTDSGLPSVQTTASYTFTVNDPPPPVVNTTPPLPPSVVNQPFTYTFTASGYGALTLSESGALPTGMAFNNNNATLSGTPTQTGSFPITVTATDQFKQNSAPADFTIVVSAHGFYVTGSMKAARLSHTATLLTGGKVLIAGGQVDINNLLATAELFDPSTGSFAATGNLQASRSEHTATLLNDGRVLLAGGTSGTNSNAVATAELYDPTGATSSATGSMLTGRYNHTATLLNNGQVLVAGGSGADGAALGSAELFNPATGVFSATGAMNSARSGHTATLLANGMVLVAGGRDANSKDLDTAELYDPTAKTFTTVAGIMTVTRVNQTATLFITGPDTGKVLLAGGFDDSGIARNSAELFDPTSKSFTATTNMISGHTDHTATLLNDGTVLLAGGIDSSGPTAVVELFDPTSGNFSTTGSLVTAREFHTSTLLNDGRALVTGGTNSSGPLASAELYK